MRFDEMEIGTKFVRIIGSHIHAFEKRSKFDAYRLTGRMFTRSVETLLFDRDVDYCYPLDTQ